MLPKRNSVRLLIAAVIVLAVFAFADFTARHSVSYVNNQAVISTPLPLPTQASQPMPEGNTEPNVVMVEATPEPTPEMGAGTVFVQYSYYVERYSYIREQYFVAKDVDLSKYLMVDVTSNDLDMVTGKKTHVTEMYMPYEAYVAYVTSQGDNNAMLAARSKMNLILQLEGGVYIELRAVRDSNFGNCVLLGGAFEGTEGKRFMALIHDVDGVSKLIHYVLDSNVLTVDFTSLYNHEEVVTDYISKQNSWGLTISGDNELRIFDAVPKVIAETNPCDDLVTFLSK